MDVKRCKKCGDSKSTDEFHKQLGKLRARCKLCVHEAQKDYKKSPAGKQSQKIALSNYFNSEKYWTPTVLYARAKASAKQHNRIFSLTKEQYFILIAQDCYYCNGLLNNEKSRGIGLDRVNNVLGYEDGNVIRCCGFCNKTRGDRLSVEEMKKVAEFIISIKAINI